MFAEDPIGINVEIMGKQHKFSCSAEQAEDFKQAAANLAVICDDIKQQKGMATNERTLLVASINLSYSLLVANNQVNRFQDGQAALISTLKNSLSQVNK